MARNGASNAFKAEAAGEQARIWHHLFKALARVGNELFLQVSDCKMCMQTLNQAQSAFASATFPDSFFADYAVTGKIDSCKILLKSMSAVFKFPANVDSFSINLDCDQSELLFIFSCRDGTTKRFRVMYELSECRQAVYNKSDSQNSAHLTKAKPLLDCISSFGSSVEEATMEVTKELINWRSFDLNANTDRAKNVQTQTTFNRRQLHRPRFVGEPTITFSVKELKFLVEFCDRIAVGVSMHFSDPGMPIIFSAERHDDDHNFELDLVLATVDLGDIEGRSLQPSQDISSSRDEEATARKADRAGGKGGQQHSVHEEREARGSRHSVAGEHLRQAGQDRIRRQDDESRERLTHDTIMSAATSDQQGSYLSPGAGNDSLQSTRGQRGSSEVQGRLDADHRSADLGWLEKEGMDEGTSRLSASQENESEFESSAGMVSALSMPSGPAPRREGTKAGKHHRPSAEEWALGGSSIQVSENKVTDSGRRFVRGGSSNGQVASAGTKRTSPELDDSDDPYSDLDDDDDIIRATPSPQ